MPRLAATRLQRWPTDKHGNADGLSRLPLGEVEKEEDSMLRIFNLHVSQIETLPVTVRQLRAATHSDLLLIKVYRFTKGSWLQQVPSALRPYSNRRHKLTVEEG